MSPSFSLQALIHTRLCANAAVTALVPAKDITDRHGRPARFPSITYGEARENRLGSAKRESARVSLDLHVWTDTPSTRDAKTIVDAARRALRNDPWLADSYTVLDLRLEGARFMPDPGAADVTHGVLTVDAFMLEAA